MELPKDNRTLTLYQSRQRGRLYWYACWTQDNGKQGSLYLGRTLPAVLQQAYANFQQAEATLQTAIRVLATSKKKSA